MGICIYVLCALCNLYIWRKKFLSLPSIFFHRPYVWIIFLELGTLYNHLKGYPDSSQNEGERAFVAIKGRIYRFRALELEAGKEERVCSGRNCWQVLGSADTRGNFGPFSSASQPPQVHLSTGSPQTPPGFARPLYLGLDVQPTLRKYICSLGS